MSGFLLPEYNIQEHNRDAAMLVDEVSPTEYYVGVSINHADTTKPTWKIKKIWKVGNIWHFGFPQENPEYAGNQEYKWIWDNRYSYIYSL